MPNFDTAPHQRRFTGLSVTARREERRTLLLDAALDVAGRDDWPAMTVRSVLERARLNPRYFYESFHDLDELAVALYDRIVQELKAAVWLALATAGPSPADQVRAVVDSIVAFVDEDRRRGRILYVEGLGNEALNRRRAQTAGMVVAFVEDYAAEQRVSSGNPDQVGRVATSVLVGGFNQLLVDWLAGRVPISRPDLVEDATALFLALGDAAARVAALRAGTPDTGQKSGLGPGVTSDVTSNKAPDTGIEDDAGGRPSDRPQGEFVDVGVVRPLRGEVLRPGRPPSASAMPDDDHPLSRHVAVFIDGLTVSVGSVIPEAPPWAPELPRAWRVRGMATSDGLRGRGLGGLVLGALIDYARDAGGRLLWCQARVGARHFYERFGFVTRGEQFVTEGIDHIHMWRELPVMPSS